jgi:hypothetical protein
MQWPSPRLKITEGDGHFRNLPRRLSPLDLYPRRSPDERTSVREASDLRLTEPAVCPGNVLPRQWVMECGSSESREGVGAV